jgi:hypothetical protein
VVGRVSPGHAVPPELIHEALAADPPPS